MFIRAESNSYWINTGKYGMPSIGVSEAMAHNKCPFVPAIRKRPLLEVVSRVLIQPETMEPHHQFSYLEYGLTNVSNILREPGSSGSGVPLVYRAIEKEVAVGIFTIAKVVH